MVNMVYHSPVVQNLTKLLSNVTLTFLSLNICMVSAMICIAVKCEKFCTAKATYISAPEVSMYVTLL